MDVLAGKKVKEYFGADAEPIDVNDTSMVVLLAAILVFWVLAIVHSLRYPFQINKKKFTVIGLGLAVISPFNYFIITLIVWMTGLNRIKK